MIGAMMIVADASTFFFPGGVRLSTWVAVIVFLALSAWRADGRPFLACLAWLWGFEAAYQLTCIVTGNGSPASTAPFLIAAGVVSVAVATRCGVLPSWPIMVVVGVVWIVWVAVGLPASLPDDFNTRAELLNELAKVLWAVAYLVPLWRLGKPMPGVDTDAFQAGDAAAADLRA